MITIIHHLRLPFLIMLCCCSVYTRAHAVDIEQQEQVIHIPFLNESIVVDGKLDEPHWQQARSVALNYVTRPYMNTRPPVSTEVKLYEDGQTLYVAFVAQDPEPQQIRAFYRDRDNVWSDDLVGIKLDTFDNGRLAYQFFVNPLGVQGDAIQNEMTGNESDSWNAIWESAGDINQHGFIVEMAIPLRTMNFQEGQQAKRWGVELVRFYPRHERLRIAHIPWDRNDACTLCQFNDVQGFEQAMQGKNLALVPTIVLGKSRHRDPLVTQNWDDEQLFEPGVDVTWGITPQMSVQATLNPDFSQVEADDAQIGINNTFTLFFDERRPFFVENADYFSSNQRLVYTRNVAQPDYGVKLTGQKDRHTFGVFVADDANATFIVPGNLGSDVAVLEEETINGALRYRFDYNNDLSVGSVSTFRQAGDYHNLVNGVDVKYRLSQQDTIRAQYVISDTQYPQSLFTQFCDQDCQQPQDYSESTLRTLASDNFSGRAWRVNYRHEQEDWFFRADRYENDKGFRADLGFETRVDFNKTIVGAGYFWWNQNSWWNRIRINGDWDITHSDQGELIERELEAYASIRGKWQSFLELGMIKRQRVGLRRDPSILAISNNTHLFEERSVSLYAETRPNPTLFLSTFARKGDQVDFANNRLGEQLFIESRLDLNLGKHAQLRFTQLYSNLNVANDTLFTARISDLRFTYQLDARQFIRLIAIYNNTHRNQQNYTFDVEPLSRNLGGQLLYSYKLNPLTLFFVGVSSAAIEQEALADLTTTDKSIFMKISYAWLY